MDFTVPVKGSTLTKYEEDMFYTSFSHIFGVSAPPRDALLRMMSWYCMAVLPELREKYHFLQWCESINVQQWKMIFHEVKVVRIWKF